MIFAAGLGTRLRPLTDSRPKALVEVAGKPLLQYVIEKLTAAGYDRIVINVHHFPDMIIDWCNSHDFGAEILISDEREQLLETGGAILRARNLLGDGRFLVHNVDIISNLDIASFEKAVPSDALAAIVVSDRPTSRYFLFDETMRLRGWTNVTTGEVRGVESAEGYRRLAFSGIHIMGADVPDVMDAEGFSGRFSIIDFYLKAIKNHPVYGVVPSGFSMVDVGKAGILENIQSTIATITTDSAKAIQ